MAPFLLGAFLLVLIIVLLRAFAFADPKQLVKGFRYSGVAIFGSFAVFLVVVGRWVPAMFLGSMAWGLVTRGHAWPGSWPHFSGARRSGSGPQDGQSTTV